MTDGSTVRILGLSTLDLFFQDCECGTLTIHGFHQQLKWKIDRNRLVASPDVCCSQCGALWTHEFKIQLHN